MNNLDVNLFKKYYRDISVLLVESDEFFREEIVEVLQEIFTNISITVDGLDALDKYKKYYKTHKTDYDLIISSIQMPKMDGVQLIDEIYKINPNQKIVVIANSRNLNYLISLINLGIEHFFSKPIDYKDFAENITKICSKIYVNKNERYNNNIVEIDKTLFWDKKQKILMLNNQNIKLTKKEITLVSTILKEKGRIYTTEELIRILWVNTFSTDIDIKNLKNIISRLRKKVPNLKIKNIYGMGYKIDL